MSTAALPATMTATAANGHRMTYNVTGRDPETGRLTYTQWDAQHADTCPCLTAEDAEPLPEW